MILLIKISWLAFTIYCSYFNYVLQNGTLLILSEFSTFRPPSELRHRKNSLNKNSRAEIEQGNSVYERDQRRDSSWRSPLYQWESGRRNQNTACDQSLRFHLLSVFLSNFLYFFVAVCIFNYYYLSKYYKYYFSFNQFSYGMLLSTYLLLFGVVLTCFFNEHNFLWKLFWF